MYLDPLNPPTDLLDPQPVAVRGKRQPIGVMGKDGKPMPGWEASSLADSGWQNQGAMLPGLPGPPGMGSPIVPPTGQGQGLSSEDAQKVLAAMNDAVGMPHPSTMFRPSLGTINPVTGAMENLVANPEYQARLAQYQDKSQGVLQAMQAAQGQQKLGTERAQAGLQEYGLKVRGPEEDLAKLAGEEMRSRTQERVAEINQKSALQQATLQGIQAKIQSGQPLTKDDVDLMMALPKALEGQMRGARSPLGSPGFIEDVRRRHGMPPVGVRGPTQPISVQGGGPVVEDRGDAMDVVKKLVDTKARKVDTPAFVAQALGSTLDSRGVPSAGKWDPLHAAATLAGFDPGLIGDDQVDRLLAEAMKTSGKQKDEMMSDLSKAYMRLSRQSGSEKGVGAWQLSDPGGWGTDVVLSHPEYGKIQGVEPSGFAAHLGLSQSQNALTPLGVSVTQSGRAAARKHALAAERLLNRFLSANYGGK